MNKRIKLCPVCNQNLDIVEYHCPHCDITIRGKFGLGELGALSLAEQEFVKVFLCAQGSIKEVERRLKISYPTVKARLLEITNKICPDAAPKKEDDIFNEIASGSISVEEALKKLNTRENK